jgi:hypothetical protein
MGMTYTICYCIRRKCKSRLGEDKETFFDATYWSEIADNAKRYLAEEVCVPGTSSANIIVPDEIVSVLAWFISVQTVNPTECHAMPRNFVEGKRVDYAVGL